MTKAIVISIQPQHVKNIKSGKKTIELRKSVAKDFKGWVYIYETLGKQRVVSSNLWEDKYPLWYARYTKTYPKYHTYLVSEGIGEIVARFWLDQTEDITEEEYMISWDDLSANRLMTDTLNEQEILEKSCLTIDQLYKYWNLGNLYAWHIKKLEVFDEPVALSDFQKEEYAVMPNGIFPAYQPITRAPQSWMYVYTNEQLP